MQSYWNLLIDGLSRVSSTKISPVLGGVQDIVVANQLRRGIMDTDVITTNEAYDPNAASCSGMQNWRLCELPADRLTEEVRRKRELVRVRMPGFVMWRYMSYSGYLAMKDFVVDDELYIAREIEKSTREHPSPALLDYAHAGDMDVTEAYEYLKLYSEEQISRRLTLHAISEKVANQLNTCMNTQEVDAVCQDMRRMFRGRKST